MFFQEFTPLRFARKRWFVSAYVFPTLVLYYTVGLPGQGPGVQKHSNRQEAIRLWELAVLAKGGRARLYQVTNFVGIYGNPRKYDWPRRHGGLVEALYVLPDRSWKWDDHPARVFAPVSPNVEVYDGSTGTFMDHAGPKYEARVKRGETHFDRKLLQLKEDNLVWNQLVFLMETRWVKPVPAASSRVREKDKWVDVVETEGGVFTTRYFLDGKTHLPIKVVTVRHDINDPEKHFEIVWLGDYVYIDGIAMPRKLGFFDGKLAGPVSFHINVEYDDRIFQNLPRIEDGPEAWRKTR